MIRGFGFGPMLAGIVTNTPGHRAVVIVSKAIQLAIHKFPINKLTIESIPY